MISTRALLLEILEHGSLKIDDVERRLALRRDMLGFGVEPEDIISTCIAEGLVVAFSDGDKTYLRIPAPFVTLYRAYQDIEYLTYKSNPDSVNGYQRHAIKPVKDQVIEIRWPDRTITKETVVTDQHPYRRIPGFNMVVRGASVWVPLDHPGLKVRADAF